MTSREKREAYRQKYKGRYKEKVKRQMMYGYIEMGALNLELAEEGIGVED